MKEEVRREIGGRIREFRESLGLSQSELSDELGKTRQTVSAWESGKALPKSEEWLKLGRMGMSLDYVVLNIRNVPVSKYAKGQAPALRHFGEPFGTPERLPAS